MRWFAIRGGKELLKETRFAFRVGCFSTLKPILPPEGRLASKACFAAPNTLLGCYKIKFCCSGNCSKLTRANHITDCVLYVNSFLMFLVSLPGLIVRKGKLSSYRGSRRNSRGIIQRWACEYILVTLFSTALTRACSFAAHPPDRFPPSEADAGELPIAPINPSPHT